MPLFQGKRTRLTVAGKDVPAESFDYGGTGRIAAAGVVDVGVGRPADYAVEDVAGKIVIVSRDEAFHRTLQLAQVIARGGAAMLDNVSGSPDNLIQAGAVRFAQFAPAPILTVAVGGQDGAALRAALAADNGLQVALEVEATREDAVARNVIGVRRGDDASRQGDRRRRALRLLRARGRDRQLHRGRLAPVHRRRRPRSPCSPTRWCSQGGTRRRPA